MYLNKYMYIYICSYIFISYFCATKIITHLFTTASVIEPCSNSVARSSCLEVKITTQMRRVVLRVCSHGRCQILERKTHMHGFHLRTLIYNS